MGTYSRFVSSAKRLISKYGESCEWHVNNDDAAENPDEPWHTAETEPVKHAVKIAWFTNDNTGFETIAKMLGADVSTGNVIGYMAAVNFDPTDADTIIRLKASKTLSIDSIDKINPNGETTILYVLKCTQ